MALSGTYTTTTPQGIQQINNTQAPIQINFSDIQDLFSVNHGALGSSNSDEGLHTFISYYNQTNDPSTTSTNIALYSKQITATTDQNPLELFVRYQNNGTVSQLTGRVSGGGVSTNGINGFQYLSGGIAMIFGFIEINPSSATATATITFPSFVGFSGFTATPFHMEMCTYAFGNAPTQPYGQVFIIPISSTQFQVTYNALFLSPSQGYNSIQFYWLAIGI